MISGEGADGIGFFGIDGRYYAKERECCWIKTYFGLHSVEYSGFREKKGIWGTWTIEDTKGGFHIWPIGEGMPVEKLREEVEEEFPILTVAQTPNAVLKPTAESVTARPPAVACDFERCDAARVAPAPGVAHLRRRAKT
jgi:hypothetical protein